MADISLDDLIVFVGNNNSGKTMLMQLIYGLRKVLLSLTVPIDKTKRTDSNGQYLIRCDRDWFREVELQANKYLAENRARIIEEIFGVRIPIGEIKVALDGDEETYFVSSISAYRNTDGGNQRTGVSIDTRQYENGENIRSLESRIPDCELSEDAAKEALKVVWRFILSEKTASDFGQLFLPASRSGLQLLYKYYFAEGTAGSLAIPMKDFLRFLQLYTEEKQLNEAKCSLLEFGEEHLLQGKVVQKGDETFYTDKYADKTVSLYMASSMIHELTPFIKALSATQRIDWLYCDEVENSLHPLMQREMARWLIRMVNAGMHVIISSHSDTMASRLNNLLMLTQLNQGRAEYELLSELELKDADLLRTDAKAGVYEFRNGKQGKTTVEKLEFISHPLMGYDFRLFGNNLDKLYDEADKITR
ncbi:MAG: ATP-binding protein [Roseburia sp.]|nr:ATP-binding protein [Roseburia sp.]